MRHVREFRNSILPSIACLSLCLLTACATPSSSPYTPSSGHLRQDRPDGVRPPETESPEPATQTPILPPPSETYTISVNEVPVKELLFSLARDAAINVDIHPGIEGVATVNAVRQTFPRILARIENQAPIRHFFRDGTLVVMPDTPFLKTYRVDYVNMERISSSEVRTSTKIATGTGMGTGTGDSSENTSNTLVTNASDNQFWGTLTDNIVAILDQGANRMGTPGRESNSVIVNAETGLVTIRATAKQHRDIRAFIEQVMLSARRQVLIEATIVEVELNDRYQTGIDWETFTNGAGLRVKQAVSGAFALNLSTENTTGLTLSYADASLGSERLDLSMTVRLLRQFGNVRVLSSPKIMTLNNQTALLKVVDNEIYFELEVEEQEDEETNKVDLSIKSKVKTVPVGLLMNVTPQINHRDFVTLNVRPTITRIKEYRDDPGVAIISNRLADSNISSKVPVVQVRETESMLEVRSGRIAVIGGLMQDRIERDADGLPWLSGLPGVGKLFTFRHRNLVKTELMIFLRPTVIREADVESDLSSFRRFLGNGTGSEAH